MLGQRSGRIILGNPEAGNATVIRLLQQPKGGAGYCDSLDILLQWNSAPFTAGDAIPLSIQIKGAGLVIRAFLSRFEIPRPRPSSSLIRVDNQNFRLDDELIGLKVQIQYDEKGISVSRADRQIAALDKTMGAFNPKVQEA